MSKGIYSELSTRDRLDEFGNPIHETNLKNWAFNEPGNAEPFFLTYVKSISWIYGITSINTIKVLYKLLETSEFNTNRVEISAQKRSRIIKELDISDSSFTKSLKQLTDLKVLEGSKGSYIIDENIFWKGDRKTRKALMDSKLKITLTPIQEEKVDTETGEILENSNEKNKV